MRGAYRLQRRARQRCRQPELADRSQPPPTLLNRGITGPGVRPATLSLGKAKETSRHLDVTSNDVVPAIAAGGVVDFDWPLGIEGLRPSTTRTNGANGDSASRPPPMRLPVLGGREPVGVVEGADDRQQSDG